MTFVWLAQTNSEGKMINSWFVSFCSWTCSTCFACFHFLLLLSSCPEAVCLSSVLMLAPFSVRMPPTLTWIVPEYAHDVSGTVRMLAAMQRPWTSSRLSERVNLKCCTHNVVRQLRMTVTLNQYLSVSKTWGGLTLPIVQQKEPIRCHCELVVTSGWLLLLHN